MPMDRGTRHRDRHCQHATRFEPGKPSKRNQHPRPFFVDPLSTVDDEKRQKLPGEASPGAAGTLFHVGDTMYSY